MTEIPIAVVKCKVGPLQARYFNGEFRDVEREKDGKKRVVVCGLDNSHNGDYKVAYASDPLIVVHAEEPGYTHEQLREKLQDTGLWLNEFQPVEIPTHPNEWLAGFQSLPRSANRLGLFETQIEKIKADYPMRQGDNHVVAVI